MKATALTILLAFCACTSNARPVNGPDGEPGWISITCKKSQANCYERAGDECPNGYRVAREGGSAGEVVMVNQGSAFAGPVYNGHLLVKCK